MTFYEKYPQLKEKESLTQILVETVFTTMSLENQQVPKKKVEEIVLSLLADQELKSSQISYKCDGPESETSGQQF